MKIDTKPIVNLPAFLIHSPTPKQQEVLKFISKVEDGVTKKQILSFLNKNYNDLSRDGKSKEIMNLNRQIIDKLLSEWKMITIEGKGKNSSISLNDEGKQFIQFI